MIKETQANLEAAMGSLKVENPNLADLMVAQKAVTEALEGLNSAVNARVKGPMKDRTTNLEKVRAGAQFTWGNVVKLHELGGYVIAEYHPWECEGVQVFVGRESKETSFHAWVDGKDISCSWCTLEGAISWGDRL